MKVKDIEVGKTVLTCHKTGKKFTVQRDGCSFNYATDSKGNYYSDEGVYLALKDEVLKDTKIFAYADLNKRIIQGWKSEHTIGKILCHYTRSNGFCGKMDHIEVKMFDGSLWKGKFKSESMQCVTLRKCK